MNRYKKRIKMIFFIINITLISRLIYTAVIFTWNKLAKTNLPYISSFMQWDSVWYRHIIEYGYRAEPRYYAYYNGQADWAFFPLYPAVIRFFKNLTGLDTYLLGFIISTLFLMITMYIVYNYISLTRSENIAYTALLLLVFGPYSFYFSSLYTESLYILLLAVAFYNLHKNNWLYCGLSGALLSATRVTGVLFFIPLLYKMIKCNYKKSNNFFTAAKDILRDEKKMLVLLLIPAGLFAYMTYLYFLVGDPFAFINVQRSWGRSNGNPLIVLINGFRGNNTMDWYKSFYLSCWGLLGIICSAYLLLKRRIEEGIFALMSILIPLMSGVHSIPRFFVGSLVLSFALNDIINYFKLYKWPIILTLASVNILLFFLWINELSITF